MKRNIEEAIENLKSIRIKNITDKKLETNIERITRNRVPIGKADDLINKTETLEVYFKPVEIYWLLKAFFETYSLEIVNPERYFDIREIEEYEAYYISNEALSEERLIVIPNVKKVSDDTYHCYKCSFETIKEAYEDGITNYDFRTQREGKLVMKNGIAILRPTIINKNLNDIKKEILSNTFTPNTITWNILDNGETRLDYNEENETLTIYKNPKSVVSIIDGMHRTMGIIRALREKDIEEFKRPYMYVTILNYSIEDAQRYIAQEQKGSKLSTPQQSVFENDIYVSCAKRVNNDKTYESNSMKDKVALLHQDEYKFGKLITLNSLSGSIKMFYEDKLKQPRDVRKVSEWIIEFMNEVIGIKEADFEKINTSRENSVVTMNNMISVFIGISRYFYDNKNEWENRLEELIENIDFSLENKYWKDNLIQSNRWDKKVEKNIIKVVKDLIKL